MKVIYLKVTNECSLTVMLTLGTQIMDQRIISLFSFFTFFSFLLLFHPIISNSNFGYLYIATHLAL